MILFGWRGGLVVSHVSVLYMWVPCLLRTKYWNGTRFSSTSLRFLFSKFSWLWELLFQGKSLPSDWLICLLSMSIPWQLRFLCLYYYLSRLFFFFALCGSISTLGISFVNSFLAFSQSKITFVWYWKDTWRKWENHLGKANSPTTTQILPNTNLNSNFTNPTIS